MSIFFQENVAVDPTCTSPFLLENNNSSPKQYQDAITLTCHIGTSVDILIWSIVECGIVLIAACLLTLMPLFHSVAVVLHGRWSHRSGTRNLQDPSDPDSQPSWRTKGAVINTPNRGFARIDNQRNFYHGHSDGQGDAVPLTPLPATPGSGYQWAIPRTSL